MKASTSKSTAEEHELKELIQSVEQKGWKVRREKLARGASFRVKSGTCKVFGDRILFLDKNLPVSQQLSILSDYYSELTVSALTVSALNVSALNVPG